MIPSFLLKHAFPANFVSTTRGLDRLSRGEEQDSACILETSNLLFVLGMRIALGTDRHLWFVELLYFLVYKDIATS